MSTYHRNKTYSALLAALAGALGAHRFYLYGKKDIWGWVHLASLPLSLLFLLLASDQALLFTVSPLVFSALTGCVEALVIGVTPDEKWDAEHNPSSARISASGWPLAVVLVLTLGVGAIALISTIARTFDLLFTGGAYG